MPDCEAEIGPLISSPGAPVTPFIPPDLMSDESGSTLPISESEDSASILLHLASRHNSLFQVHGLL